MRFQVQSPDGVPHDVELQGRIAVVGRDPTCDLVLHDVKCSRRHAVVEAGPEGLTIRDTGSANGVFLNERKIERASLKTGDLVRLGDSVLRVLPDEVEGTVVMGFGDDGIGEVTVGDDAQPPALPVRRTAPPPLPRDASPAPGEGPPADEGEVETPAPAWSRPLTVNVLAALWLMSVPMYALGGLALAARFSGAGAVLTAASGFLLAALAAALGVLVCPFTLASVVVLAYMLTPAGAAAFAEGAPEEAGRSPRETGFAAALLVTVLLGALVTMLVLFLPRLATRLS